MNMESLDIIKSNILGQPLETVILCLHKNNFTVLPAKTLAAPITRLKFLLDRETAGFEICATPT